MTREPYVLQISSEYAGDLERLDLTKKGPEGNPFFGKLGKVEIEEVANSFLQEMYFEINPREEERREQYYREPTTSNRAIVALSPGMIEERVGIKNIDAVERLLGEMKNKDLVKKASEGEVLEDKVDEEVYCPTERLLKILKD